MHLGSGRGEHLHLTGQPLRVGGGADDAHHHRLLDPLDSGRQEGSGIRLGAVPEHHVAVYQTNDRISAHLGELSVTSLKARGARGAVIDGGCRDVDYVLRQDYPVFCRYTTPQDCVVRWELTAVNVAVTVGGVRIEPGDYIVADHDGIVVVPDKLRDGVLEEAESKVATEGDIRAAVQGGALPLEAYDRFGTF